MIVKAKKVILFEKCVFGMLGPFKIFRRDLTASLLFSSMIIFAIYSELAISAKNSLSTLCNVSSSLHFKYSRIAIKPFIWINMSLISSLKLQRLTKAEALREAKLKLDSLIVIISGSTRLMNSIFVDSSSFLLPDAAPCPPPGVFPGVDPYPPPPDVLPLSLDLSSANILMIYLHEASLSLIRSVFTNMYFRKVG